MKFTRVDCLSQEKTAICKITFYMAELTIKMEWIWHNMEVSNSILMEWWVRWTPNMEWWVTINNSIFRCKDLLCKQYLIFFPKNYPIPTFFLIIVIHLCLNNQVWFLMMHRWWVIKIQISMDHLCTQVLAIKAMFISNSSFSNPYLLHKTMSHPLPKHNLHQEHSKFLNNLRF